MLFNTRFLSQFSLATLLVTCTMFGSLPAIAENATRIALASGSRQSVRVEQLKFAPTLAFVPTYTGRNFISKEAVRYTGLPTGECYNLTYMMREDSAMVLNWYQDALRQSGWTVDDTTRSKFSLSATHAQGLCCLLFVRPTQSSGFATELTLRFSIRPS
ncbi:MAG: hypothetical protein K2W95_33810 [Candidatus Obscuribacterales bacterium]|nr:hypothetical protein [Candidatus Obscuribacterales bacterium]